MPETPPFEIPEAMRQLAEKNVEQARTAYNQFAEMARKAQDAVAKSSGAVADSAVEIQNQTLRFAQEQVDASFKLASELARARDVKEYFEIQSRFAQNQMRSYTDQAQELGRLMASMAQKAQSGR